MAAAISLLERLQRLERQVGAVVAGGQRDTAGELPVAAGAAASAASAARAEGMRQAAMAAAPPSNEVFRKSLREVKWSVVIIHHRCLPVI